MTAGKKYESTLEKFDRQHLYTVGEAIDLVKELAHAKFDETVELAVRLGVDPRKADQIVRGTLSLPHGTGRTVRVAVFAAGDPPTEAAQRRGGSRRCRRPGGPGRRWVRGLRRRDRHAGPDGPGRSARPDPRPAGPHAEPEDRNGHNRRRQGGRRSSRPDGSSTARTRSETSMSRSARSPSPGRSSSTTCTRWSKSSSRVKPASSKGRYLKAVTLSSTMGPGIHVDPAKVRELVEEDVAAIA